jgi:hypothetical protein
MQRACKSILLARGALVSKTLADLELGTLRGLSTSTDLKAVLAEKIPAEQVGFLNLDFYFSLVQCLNTPFPG